MKSEDRAQTILDWAARNGRNLPWRHTRDPWAILVSEVMAQQTQVERVIPKWESLLAEWPTSADCAAASLGDVLRLWQGLGFPRRAKQLHAAAEALAKMEHFPQTLPELLSLPGVGPYTARAVLAFAFEHDVAVVDTNTARVLARWQNRVLNRAEVQTAADGALPPGSGWVWNQALLDFGSLICTRTNPRCDECPVQTMCAYGRNRGRGDNNTVDPATGTAGVSVPQSRFQGSDRQLRGKLLRAASAGGLLRSTAADSIGSAHQTDRVEMLIEQLLAEGLLELRDSIRGDELRFPE